MVSKAHIVEVEDKTQDEITVDVENMDMATNAMATVSNNTDKGAQIHNWAHLNRQASSKCSTSPIPTRPRGLQTTTIVSPMVMM